MKQVRVDLKICEGCGALWLRALGRGVYCRRCEAILSDFPAPRGQSRRGRKPAVTRVAVTCPGGAR